MIVRCPKCSSRYQLNDERIGEEGVQVRCTSCQTVFKVPPPEPVSGESATQLEGQRGGVKILVCDDAPFFRTMVKDILTEAGYAVELAATGEEALTKVAETGPALLVLDLQLPGMNGFEVVKRIRASEAWKALPILAMSAVYTDSSDIMSLQDVGADDYIGKKFKPEHLLHRIEHLLKPKEENW